MEREIYQQIIKSTDRVGIDGVKFYAYHGHRSEENILGQRFSMNVDAFLDLKQAAESDNLEDTLNYHDLHGDILKWVTAHRFKLLEALVNGVAEEIFQSHSQVKALKIVVKKMQPPIPDFYGHVEVEITRVNPGLLK